jgi:hypothetical protein
MKDKKTYNRWKRGVEAACALCFLVLYSCASIGSPDGGPYDETPPKVIRTSPAPFALNNKNKKISIEFDEFIKLENASEKVVISPPQLEQAEIKVSGKKVVVALADTLKEASTYTIDFSDAIVDNNEENPLGNYTFTFSTGEVIDTMEVAGTVIDASNLEPVKGILVGLHANQEDSAFVKLPLERVARTDSRGHFVIRGVAPGSYRIYALNDINQNFMFDQKSEMIAFSDEIIQPSFEPAIRQDTVWRDSLTFDSIRQVPYTHFLPDNIVLRAFTETPDFQYLSKSERLTPSKFSLYFAVPADTLPIFRGLNFDEKESLVIEHTLRNDTIHYWIKDSTVYNLDTLQMELTYLATDTLGKLSSRTDTLELAPKKTRAQIAKEAAQKLEEWEKEMKKKLKKNPERTDTIPPKTALKVTLSPTGTFDLNATLKFSFEEPLARFDTAAVHVFNKVDTLWTEIPFVIEPDGEQIRSYNIYAEWRPEQEYKVSVDSLAFESIYGLVSGPLEQSLKVPSLDEYSTLFVKVPGMPQGVVQLLSAQDTPLRSAPVKNGRADFYFVKPGKYYLRLFNDRNGNGTWDPGLYETHTPAEEVYYYPQSIDLKAMWDVEQDWNVEATPVEKQKPAEIKKTKEESKKKTAKDRNLERLRQKNS